MSPSLLTISQSYFHCMNSRLRFLVRREYLRDMSGRTWENGTEPPLPGASHLLSGRATPMLYMMLVHTALYASVGYRARSRSTSCGAGLEGGTYWQSSGGWDAWRYSYGVCRHDLSALRCVRGRYGKRAFIVFEVFAVRLMVAKL
jgi:hypothetical protein